MGICRWCGAVIPDRQDLAEHEQIHRDTRSGKVNIINTFANR